LAPSAGWNRSQGLAVHRPLAKRQVPEDATTVEEVANIFRTAPHRTEQA
jgi:hypothetical protein